LQKDEIEESVKLVTNLAEMADALEAESLKKTERRGVFRVDAGDHRVLAGLACMRDERVEQKRTDALSAQPGCDVHGSLDRVAIAGPGAEIAVATEAADTLALYCDEDGEVLLDARVPPGNAIGNARRSVVVMAVELVRTSL
jgi:hypothetical protein